MQIIGYHSANLWMKLIAVNVDTVYVGTVRDVITGDLFMIAQFQRAETVHYVRQRVGHADHTREFSGLFSQDNFEKYASAESAAHAMRVYLTNHDVSVIEGAIAWSNQMNVLIESRIPFIWFEKSTRMWRALRDPESGRLDREDDRGFGV